MHKKILKSLIVVLVCNALIYAPFIRAEQLSLPATDVIAPDITQEVYEQTVPPDKDHEITVKVTDNVGVDKVILYFSVIGSEDYTSRVMQKVSGTDNFRVKIDADEIKSPGIQYYVQARDLAGNSSLHGQSFSPISVKIDKDAPQPYAATTSIKTTLDSDNGDDKKISKWVWIGLGAVVVGALALSGGGGDDGTIPTETATLNISASDPTQ